MHPSRCLVPLLLLVSAAASADPEPPKISVATDPIALMYGTYTGSITRVATLHTAVRIDGQISESPPVVADSAIWRFGVSLPIYFDRAMRGPFIEPGVAIVSRRAASNVGVLGGGAGPMAPSYFTAQDQTIGPQIFVGWQWCFDSGLNIAAAIGASRNVPSSGYGAAYPRPESYLRVGYAF